MSVGFRVLQKRNLPDPALVEAFSRCRRPTCRLQGEAQCASSQIKLLSSPAAPIMAGVALTVKRGQATTSDPQGTQQGRPRCCHRRIEEGDRSRRS
jgi:hypothetical protein